MQCAKMFARYFLSRSICRKIPNTSPGLIKVRKYFVAGLYRGEACI